VGKKLTPYNKTINTEGIVLEHPSESFIQTVAATSSTIARYNHIQGIPTHFPVQIRNSKPPHAKAMGIASRQRQKSLIRVEFKS
jgi:hypothetical protein